MTAFNFDEASAELAKIRAQPDAAQPELSPPVTAPMKPEPFDFNAASAQLARTRAEDKALDAQFLRYRQQNAAMPAERQAEVFRTAAALRSMGETPALSFVEQNLEPLKKRVDAHSARWDDLLRDHPSLGQYLLETPQRQDLVSDDLKNLDGLAWTLKVPGLVFKKAVAEQEYFGRTFAESKGFGSEANRAAIKALEPQVEAGYGAEHWYSKMYTGTLNMLPMLARYAGAGALGGWIGGTVAALPALGGAAATPEFLGAGGIATEVAGVSTGVKLATGALTYYETVGPAYQRMIRQGVRSEIAHPLAEAEAVATGAIFAGAMPAMLAKLGIGPKAIVGELGAETAKVLEQKALPQILKQATVKWGQSVGHAALMMGAVGAVSQTTSEVAGWLDHGESPDVKRIALAVGNSMIAAVRDMSIISAFGPAREAFSNIGESARLGQEQAQLEEAIKGAESSRLLDRSPDEFKALFATLGQSGLRKLYSPIDAFNAYWESRRANPREVAAKLTGDDGAAYDHAVQTGGDLPMPVENYLAVLGKTEHARGLSQDIKIRPDGRTPRQEQKRVERRAEELAKIPLADIRMEKGRELVADWFRKTLERSFAGNKRLANPEAVAEKTAKLQADAFDRMAQEINKNANEGTEPITAWDIFRAKARVESVGQKGVRAGDIQAEAYADPASLALLEQAHGNLSSDEQLRAYYTDRNTGLLSERGAELRAPDPARPMTARFSLEGKKSANDLFGHLSVDGALRIMARSLATDGQIRDGVKRGGGIEADVRDQAHADELAASMSKALDPSGRVKVIATAAERLPTTEETLKGVGIAHDAREAAMVAAGDFANREQLPVGYAGKPGEFSPVADAWRNADASGANADLALAHAEAFAAIGHEQTSFETYRERSGLLSELGFHRALELSKPKFVVSADARGLKKMNVAMGREKADIVLDILSETFARQGGGEIDLAHLHGDEYAAGGNDRGRIEDFLDTVSETTKRYLFVGKRADGGYFLQEGLHFVYGIDANFDRADRVALPAAKAKQGSVAEPQRFDTREELDAAVDEILARHSDYRPVDLDRLAQQRHGRGAGAPSGEARSGGGSVAGQQANEVRRPGAPAAGREDLGSGVSPAAVGGTGPESPGPPRSNDVALQGSAEARQGEVALGSDTPKTKAARGVVFHKTDSTTLPRAWSHWDAYQHVMETIGGSDASPSEQADGQYRKWLADNKRARPGQFGGPKNGHFDEVNKELERPKGDGVSGALEAWVELNKKLKTGLRWENMQRVIDVMRTVPGMERMRLPEAVEVRLLEARHNADIETEHGVTAAPVKLEQPGKDGLRGSIEFQIANGSGKPRRYIVDLSGADESTAAHETFHMLTEVMHDVATAKNAPPDLKADYEDLIKWMGHASPEERVANTKERIALDRKKTKGTITPDEERKLLALGAKEERATAGWEQYLLEGKSPSARLADVFSRFGGWLAKIYRGGTPGQQFEAAYGEQLGLTPEVKAIFDRLLASERQLDATQAALEMQPLPAAHRGMTPGEQAEYATATENMQAEARNALLRAIANDKRTKSHIVDEERSRLTEERNAELDREPVYRALSFLQDRELINVDPKTGDVTRVDPPAWLVDPETGKTYRMDRKSIDNMLSKGGWKTLPASTTVAKGGIAAGEIAEFLGFDSAETMVRALQESTKNPRAELVKRDVQAKLNEMFGPALLENPSALFAEALAGEHNDAAARRIMLELRSLRRQLNKDIDPRIEAVSERTRKETARRLIAERKIGELAPGYYRRAEQFSAKRALEAALAGNLEKAMAERETQLLNQYLYRYAREAKEQTDHIQEQLQKKTTDTYRAGLGKAVHQDLDANGKVIAEHREYLDAHDAIMAAIGIGRIRPGDFKLDDLLARMDLDAADVSFDVGVVRDVLTNGKPYNQLTAPEAVEIDAAIKNIRAAANAVREIVIDGQRVAVKALVDGIREDLEQLPNLGKEPNSKTQVDIAKRALLAVQGLDGGLLDPATWIEFMGERAKRFFSDRYLEARRKRDELLDSVMADVLGAYESMPEALRDRRHEVIDGLDADLPVGKELNLEGPRDRQWLWMAFLNMGNRGPKSNAERLTKPFGWTEEQVEAAIGKHLTKEECDFLQRILTITDLVLWPEIAAKEERKVGLAPEKIKASPINITFADGTTRAYDGGYFPAKYRKDASAGDIAEKQAESTIQSFYGPNYERASTPKSHTKARAAGYANVLDLSWAVVPNHLGQVVHDIAFDEYVRDTARVLLHPDLHDAIYQHLGAKRSVQPKAWLKAVANAFADAVPESMRWWYDVTNPIRSRVVAAAIGLSVPVALGDLANAPIAIAAGDVGVVNGMAAITRGFAEAPLMLIGKSPMRNTALEKSPELRHRARHYEKLVQEKVKSIGKNQSDAGVALERAHMMLYAFQDATDAISSTQIWWGAYNDAMGKHGDETAAVKWADDKVSRNLPSHDVAEQSALVRDKRGVGALLIFQTWTNKLYNINRRIAHRAYLSVANESAGEAVLQTGIAAAKMLAVIALAGPISEFMSGRGKSDDETTWQWVLRKMMGTAMSQVPFGGYAAPAADYAVTGRYKPASVRSAPVMSLFEDASKHIGNLASDTRGSSQKVWDAIDVLLLLLGGPVRQTRRTGEYITNLVQGDAEDTSPLGVASGVVYGERDNQSANPFRPTGRN